MQVLFGLENLFSEVHIGVCAQKRVNEHMLNGDGYTNDEIISNCKLRGTHSFYGYKLICGVCTELGKSRRYDSRP